MVPFPIRFRTCLIRVLGLPLLLSLLSPAPAFAHERIGSASHAIVTAEGDTLAYYLSIPPKISTLLRQEADENSSDFRDYFSSGLRIQTWDSVCELARIEQTPPQPSGNRIVHMVFRCPKEIKDLAITSVLFLDLDESHTQFIRLARADKPGEFLREGVFNEKHKTFHVPDARGGDSAFADRALAFFKLGVEHLLTGYDHILFLLTVIVAMTLIGTVKAVTSFTVAHSLTMALAFLGVFSLPPAVVEPLIALTIVYVSLENLLARSVRMRWVATFIFGLVHGLGFVGALREITVSRNELILSLVSFNLGIEAGQLVIIAIALPLLLWLRRFAWQPLFLRGFSLCTGAVGALWFVQRSVAA
jgi:hydrogenase/urease accessory protein HupE